MLKKLFTFLLMSILLLSVVACDSATQSDENMTSETESEQSVTEEVIQTEETTVEPVIDWPTGDVIIYVGANAGANLDLKARIIAKYLAPELGVSVVVENRAGAGGVTACTEYLSEEANTNNLQYMAGSYLSVAPVFGDVQYTSDDFITVAGVDTVANGIFVNADLGITNLEELKAYAEGRTIKFGSIGVTNDVFLISKSLMNSMEINSDTVQGNSLPDCILNVISGNADITYCAMNLAKQYVQDGSLIPLGALTDEDYTGYSDIGIDAVPSIKSQGYDISYSAVTYLAIRRGTDQQVIDKLYDALEIVYENPEFQAEMDAMGIVMLTEKDPKAVSELMEKVIESINHYADMLN